MVEPFLRWAGGKSWFVRAYRHLLPDLSKSAYHEPFVGGGSVFFAIPKVARARLTDGNSRLIETYVAVRDHPTRVISYLEGYENTEDFYYELRESKPSSKIERAAQFIFLNQTSFNGIYRVNLKGRYNVPYGHRSKPFLDENAILRASQRLKNVDLHAADFFESASHVRRGDFVFIDPPYTVSHNKNGFIKYNEKLFSLADFHRLHDYIATLKKIGARYLMTNAAHEYVRGLFDFGDTVIEVRRANLIGGKGASRAHVSELIFTNLDGFDAAT